MKFARHPARHLGSSTARMPVKFLSHTIIIASNLAASRLGRYGGKTSYRLVNRGPGLVKLISLSKSGPWTHVTYLSTAKDRECWMTWQLSTRCQCMSHVIKYSLSGARCDIKTVFPSIWIPVIKIIQSWDCFISIITIVKTIPDYINSCISDHFGSHYSDAIMGTMTSQITGACIVYSTVCSDQRRHQSSMSPAFARGIHRWPMNSPHEGPVTWKMFPFDDVIIRIYLHHLPIWSGLPMEYNTLRQMKVM